MLLAVVLSAFVGVSLGLLGGGGSILMVPILVYVVGLEPEPAIATSLFVVGVTSLSAMAAHARAGRVRFRVGGSFGLASMAGAFIGARAAHFVPGSIQLAAFTVVMAITGGMMLRPQKATPPAGASSHGRIAVVGALAGMLTGLVGAGGGFIVVPALVLLCGLSMCEAIATSLLVIAMNSLAGFAGHLGHVPIDVRLTAILTLAAVSGSAVGALFAGRTRPESLRRAFALLVLAMAAFMTCQQLPGALRAAVARV
jgi:uncharacterized membrane protein YfcA